MMSAGDDRASGACAHPQVSADGRCALCGGCIHELVLNGACYACGETEIVITNKPLEPAVVPAARLARPRRPS